MDWLDGIVIVVLLAAIVRGIELGLVRQVCSGIGFFGGLFIGVWAEGRLIHLAHTSDTRTALSVSVILGCAFLLLIIGEYIGDLLKSRLVMTRVNSIDRLLGSLAAACIVLAAVWLGVNVFSSLPVIGWQQQVQRSAIVRTLNGHLPAAPTVLARIGRVISPNGFPQVFNGLEPDIAAKTVQQPDMGVFTAAIAKDAASVVKVEGKGCGGIVEGSGFIVDTNTVITNAHVVAGVAQPEIIDAAGHHSVRVIWFDPNLDLAVLRTQNLAGKPLVLSSTVLQQGTASAILGYPGGGGFTATPSAIIEAFTATGQNIYNAGNVSRQIYLLRGTVIAGNSGGPLIDTQGRVIGIVFARSIRYNDVGYALTLKQAMKEIAQAEQTPQITTTGNCAE